MPKLKIDPSKIEKFTRLLKKLDSPKAYSAYAVVGVLITTGLAIACTRKQCEYESEKIPEGVNLENKITRREIVKDTVKNYIPMIVSAGATIYCIEKSNQKWIAYNNLINSAFISARDKMARYRALAAPAVAAEVVQGLDHQKSEPDVEWFCVKDIPDHGDIYFQSTAADVIEAEYHLNRNFALRGSASVREFFAFLGIVDQFPEEFGDAYGYDVGTMMEDWGIEPWIDFEHWNTTDESTGEKINVVQFTWEPQFNPEGEAYAWGYGCGCGLPYKNFSGIGPTE